MSFFIHRQGKEKKAGKGRRKSETIDFTRTERRTGTKRKGARGLRLSLYENLPEHQRKTIDHILEKLEAQVR
jgi:hypothetical protein